MDGRTALLVRQSDRCLLGLATTAWAVATALLVLLVLAMSADPEAGEVSASPSASSIGRRDLPADPSAGRTTRVARRISRLLGRGFGLFAGLGPAAVLAISIGVWVLLEVLARRWARTYRQGLLEWLLRWWTYGARPVRHHPARPGRVEQRRPAGQRWPHARGRPWCSWASSIRPCCS